MGKDSDFAEENGEIGIRKTYKDGKTVFKSILSGTMNVVKMVTDPDMKMKGGMVVAITHAWHPDRRRTVFLKAQCFDKVSVLMAELNKLDMPIFSHNLTTRHLRSLMEYLMAKRIEQGGQVPQAHLIRHLGMQRDNCCVFSNELCVSDGNVATDSQQQYFMSHPPVKPEIILPLDNSATALKRMYGRILHLYGRDAFLNFIRMGGAALKGLHFKRLMETFRRVGVTMAVGSYNTGKSLSSKMALSGCGMSRNGMLTFITEAKQKRLFSSCGMPMCLNNVTAIKSIEQAASCSFEFGSIANCREDLSYSTTPLITCNRSVLVSLSKKMSPRELSRFALANFPDPLPELSDNDRASIDTDMETCSSGVALLVGAGDRLCSKEGLTRTKQVLDILAQNDWKGRLLHVYALDLWCAQVFSGLTGHNVPLAEFVDHFRRTTLPEVTSFQGFEKPFEEPMATLSSLLEQGLKLFMSKELIDIISVSSHAFSGNVKHDAICIRLECLLDKICSLDKCKLQSALKNTLTGSRYALSKRRFNGCVHHCTLISSTSLDDGLVVRLTAAIREAKSLCVENDGLDEEETLMDDSGLADNDCMSVSSEEDIEISHKKVPSCSTATTQIAGEGANNLHASKVKERAKTYPPKDCVDVLAIQPSDDCNITEDISRTISSIAKRDKSRKNKEHTESTQKNKKQKITSNDYTPDYVCPGCTKPCAGRIPYHL